MRGGCAFGVSFFAFSAFTDILIYTADALLLVFFLCFLVPSSGASRPGRRRSFAVSHRLLCVRTQTRISPFAIVASLQQKTIAVVSSVFGRREQCSRKACRHLAGSGSAYQVELRIGEAEGEFENGIWTLALKYSAFLEAVTSNQVIGTTSSLGPIQDTSCRDVVQLRHSRRTKAVATTTFLFSFEHL